MFNLMTGNNDDTVLDAIMAAPSGNFADSYILLWKIKY